MKSLKSSKGCQVSVESFNIEVRNQTRELHPGISFENSEDWRLKKTIYFQRGK
jgi:hypothetical protein